MNSRLTRRVVVIAALLLVVGLLFQWRWSRLAIVDFLNYLFNPGSVEIIRNYLAQFGLWTPLISFALMILQAVIPPLPTTPIASANGMLYGVWPGMLLSWSGSLTGAGVSYWIASRWGVKIVRRLFGVETVARLAEFNPAHAFWLVLVARLTPVISMDFIAYWAGLGRMGFLSYLMATAIGQAPAMLAYSILGNDLARAEIVSWRLWIIVLIGLALYFVGRFFLSRLKIVD